MNSTSLITRTGEPKGNTRNEKILKIFGNEKIRTPLLKGPDLLVRRKGLEPLTYWFVASHSIQLSYRRITHS